MSGRIHRRAVRDALIAKLAPTGQLSPLYCGFAPIEQNDLGEDASAFAEAVIAELRSHA